MLKNYVEASDKNLSPKELIKKYRDELKELCTYDNDTKDMFGFVNTWWVFGEVAKELNYKIFMAEAENIGISERNEVKSLQRMNCIGRMNRAQY